MCVNSAESGAAKDDGEARCMRTSALFKIAVIASLDAEEAFVGKKPCDFNV